MIRLTEIQKSSRKIIIKKDQELKRKASVEYLALNGEKRRTHNFNAIAVGLHKVYSRHKIFHYCLDLEHFVRDLKKSHRDLFKNPSEFDLYFPQTQFFIKLRTQCFSARFTNLYIFFNGVWPQGFQRRLKISLVAKQTWSFLLQNGGKKPHPRNFKVKAEPRNDSTKISTYHQET
eukprot:403350701